VNETKSLKCPPADAYGDVNEAGLYSCRMHSC
jgi:hypothetical protein